jgi:transposase
VDRIKINGKWKERALVNLGRQDELGRKALGELLKKLRRFSDEILVTPEEIESKGAKDYGVVLAGEKLWREIGLGSWISKCCGKALPGSLGEPGVLAMVLNRLCQAKSKLGIFDWMETVYLECWEHEDFRQDNPIALAERFYLTMDWLIGGKNKERIEESIASWGKNLFPVDVIFYDITNIQFEAWEKLKQARYGYIRLGKRNHKQILLGLVMVEGIPGSSHLFRGNRAEKTTLLWVHKKLKEQFNVGRIVFVCDNGMITQENLQEIQTQEDGYIVGLKRRKCEEVEPLLEEDLTSFTPISMGKKEEVLLSAWEAQPEASNTVAPSKEDKKGRVPPESTRRIVVFNPLKAQESKGKRLAIMKELQEKLEVLRTRTTPAKQSVNGAGQQSSERAKKTGKKNKFQTTIAAAEEILSHKQGKRYFTYTVQEDGSFEFALNQKSISKEEKLDGKFMIKTTETKLSLKEVVFKYKDLIDIEDGFRQLKDFIRVAPVYHWKYRRVKAHIFICVLALLLERYLEKKLKQAGLELSARKAFEKLKNIKVVENQVGSSLRLKYVTPPNQELDKILSACGIFKLPKILSEPKQEGLRKPKKSFAKV